MDGIRYLNECPFFSNFDNEEKGTAELGFATICAPLPFDNRT